MRYLLLTSSLLASVLFLPAAAQDYDEDDPVPYRRSDRDYYESGKDFGAAYYPHYRDRNSPVVRRYDNRGELRYPPVDPRDRYARNYGPPELASPRVQIDRYGRPVRRAAFDDPDPFDRAYGESNGRHYIAPDENNFRGGRYATDYPDFRGGWYGRGHRVRIRAGQYMAGDYANAFWEHPHHTGSSPGEHAWNANSGQAY
ncbi:MAG TPA: hypothetical protein VHC22_06695 [Pirellulales bacterium]|nr:hypothetical protein [Pirellulales bacterium]